MHSKISKFLVSNLLRKNSQLPKSLTLAHFSTIPNRAMRGDRTRGDGDGSEDKFLRNLNFGGERGRDFGGKNHQNRPPRLPNRPLRGEEPPRRRERREREDHFSQNFRAGNQNPQSFRKNDEEKIDGSMEAGGEQETLLDKLDVGDVGSHKKDEETEANTSARVLRTDPSAAETPPEDADEIFKKMKETGLIPNAVAMLDGLCKDGLVQEAMKLFGLMREKGTIPEVVVYTAVVEGFCKAAKFDDAKRIFGKMQKNGIVPNAFSYGVLVQGLCRGKRLEDAVEFVKEMLDAGHSPNAATFTGLVHEICVEKGVEEATDVVRSLRERGFAMDEKAVREYLDKKGPTSPTVWEAIFGKKTSHRPF